MEVHVMVQNSRWFTWSYMGTDVIGSLLQARVNREGKTQYLLWCLDDGSQQTVLADHCEEILPEWQVKTAGGR